MVMENSNIFATREIGWKLANTFVAKYIARVDGNNFEFPALRLSQLCLHNR